MRKDQRMFCLLVLVYHLFLLEGSGIHLQSPRPSPRKPGKACWCGQASRRPGMQVVGLSQHHHGCCQLLMENSCSQDCTVPPDTWTQL